MFYCSVLAAAQWIPKDTERSGSLPPSFTGLVYFSYLGWMEPELSFEFCFSIHVFACVVSCLSFWGVISRKPTRNTTGSGFVFAFSRVLHRPRRAGSCHWRSLGTWEAHRLAELPEHGGGAQIRPGRRLRPLGVLNWC